MKFYYTPASPPCRFIQILAEILNVPLELILTIPKNGDTKAASFLEMNPQHVVPTLVGDDGYVIWESRAIAKYLIGKYAPNDDLYPTDYIQRIEVDKILDFDLGTIFRRSSDYLASVLMTGYFDDSKIPKLEDALKVLETILGRNKSGFVAINRLTIADISILVTLTCQKTTGYDYNPYPNICKWLKKIISLLPCYQTLGVAGEKAFQEMYEKAKKF